MYYLHTCLHRHIRIIQYDDVVQATCYIVDKEQINREQFIAEWLYICSWQRPTWPQCSAISCNWFCYAFCKMYVYTYYKYVRIYPTLQNFATKKFSQITGNGEAEIFAKKILQMSLPGERVVLEYQLQNRVWNLADVSTRCSGLLQGKDGQSIWSKRRQGFQPCFEAGIWELPFPCLSQLRSPHFIRTCVNATEVAPRS